MAENGKKKEPVREGIAITLPPSYEGRCASGDYIVKHATFGNVKLLEKDAKYPKFEYRLPIPSTDEECMAMYNRPLTWLIRLGASQLGNDRDGDLKKVLFAGIEAPMTVDDNRVTTAQHTKAQESLDAWRWSEKATTQRIAANELESRMISAGLMDESEVGALSKDQLLDRISAIGSKRKARK